MVHGNNLERRAQHMRKEFAKAIPRGVVIMRVHCADFAEADRDRNAKLSFTEFLCCFPDAVVHRTPKEHLAEWFKIVNMSGDGAVSLYEFFVLLLRAELARTGLASLKQTLRTYARKGSTNLEKPSFRRFAEDIGIGRRAEDLWMALDTEHNGFVHYQQIGEVANLWGALPDDRPRRPSQEVTKREPKRAASSTKELQRAARIHELLCGFAGDEPAGAEPNEQQPLAPAPHLSTHGWRLDGADAEAVRVQIVGNLEASRARVSDLVKLLDATLMHRFSQAEFKEAMHRVTSPSHLDPAPRATRSAPTPQWVQ